MLEAVADKLHDFNLFQLFFSQSGYRDFSVINIVGVAGRYGQVMLVSLSFSTRGFVKLFEGKSLQRFDPAKTEWEILHSTSPPQGRHKRWASVVSTALPPTPCRSNHLLSSTVCWRKHKLFFYQLGWGTVETSISLDQSSLDRFFPFPPII